MRRPDPRDVLADLKDFQLRTVRHVHHRLFLDDDKIDRFLVADEVGLGKTLVARGATALAIDHLWESTERIDVLYICSNADIARQNINRLGIGGGAAYVRPTRLTLLPRAVHDLKDNKLNLVSLTPGTSFESHSAMGIAEERAILHEILRDAWGWGRQRWQRNLLCANATRKGFDGTVGWVRQGALDEELSAGFVAALEEEERTARARGESSLRQRFEELHDAFYNRQRQGVGDVEKEAQRHVIAELRKCLGESCVTALEPDFIILDEFQRFRQLLGEETEAGELAARLFSYDSHTEVPAKTLLLSATPYMPYSSSADADGAAGLDDFLATVQFLLPGEEEREQLHPLHGPSPDPRLPEKWPAYAAMPLEDVAAAYETAGEKFQRLLEELAKQPDAPRTFGEVEAVLGFNRGMVASLLGGYSQRSKRWNKRRPWHFARPSRNTWLIWMDAERAGVIEALAAQRDRGDA